MKTKYDLQKMLKEIQEDEKLSSGKQNSAMSQNDILKMVRLNKRQRKGDGTTSR